MLAGNVVALLSPLIYIPILTYAFGPQNYDYKSMLLIRLGDDHDLASSANVDLELVPGAMGLTPEENEKEQANLARASLIAKSLTGFMTLALLILWPMPMYGSGYVFSKKFFTGWVVVGILWLFCSAFCVGLYPLWEGRKSMGNTFGGIIRDLTGRGKPPVRGRRVEGEGTGIEVMVEGEGVGIGSGSEGSGTPKRVDTGTGKGEKGVMGTVAGEKGE